MNCIVVDDSKMASRSLSELISQVDFLELKKEFNDPVSAFAYLKDEKVDLVFLDVEMPGMTGLEIAKNLKDPPIIILVTSKKEYAAEAFELDAADYIIKPITLPRFMSAAYKAKELFEGRHHHASTPTDEQKGYIFVRSDAQLKKIELNEITYVEAMGDYIIIHHGSAESTVHSTLKKFEERLPSHKFYRSHRSYLLAVDHIDKIVENTAYIGKIALPIGEQYKRDLLKKLNLV